MIGRYPLGRRAWHRRVLLGLVVACILAGCGGSQTASRGTGPAFPSTPAGVQARWLLQVPSQLPITLAQVRAHVSPAVLRDSTQAEVNSELTPFGRVSAYAAGGQVLVSRTVRDLVMGSGIALHSRGEHELRGVSGFWELFSTGAESAPLPPPDPTRQLPADRVLLPATGQAQACFTRASRVRKRCAPRLALV